MLNFASNDPLSEVVDLLRTNNPLVNLDFTDLFGTEALLRDSLVYHSASNTESYVHFYSFKPAVLADINARLASVGIAPIAAGKNVMWSWEDMSSRPMPNQ